MQYDESIGVKEVFGSIQFQVISNESWPINEKNKSRRHPQYFGVSPVLADQKQITDGQSSNWGTGCR